jgi:imidazolonepropionase-like amidohydrolase
MRLRHSFQGAGQAWRRVLNLAFLLSALAAGPALAQQRPLLLQPERVFDGEAFRTGWAVQIENGLITAAGPALQPLPQAQIIALPGMTLLPGLLDLHSHVLLHPYNETPWNDQVLRESVAERSVRAAQHLQATLEAGFTSLRDLGSEGAGYADVGLAQALAKGVLAGPRLLVAGPAIVATGTYGPKGFRENVAVPQGAVEVSGETEARAETRRQIAGGADWIKVYADYRWGPNGQARPTFSVEELKAIVDTAAASGRRVAAHAATDEGARRAIQAGVSTIEHGDDVSDATLRLMVQRGVALCPTLAAGYSIARYQGWGGSAQDEPARLKAKRQSFARVRKAGVILCNGSDVGVFRHGDNALELELMVAYGATPTQALRAATATNGTIVSLEPSVGRIAPGYVADVIAVTGDPGSDIQALRQIRLVVQGGEVKLQR